MFIRGRLIQKGYWLFYLSDLILSITDMSMGLLNPPYVEEVVGPASLHFSDFDSSTPR
jgi:hypothetical protein